MSPKLDTPKNKQRQSAENVRKKLLNAIPVNERRLKLAGVSTTILEGGSGPPVILLHGPGESAFWWMRVIPDLTETHHVIIPDLPGHGASLEMDNPLNADLVLSWLKELIDNTCTSPPVLVGHVFGGSIASRFAIADSNSIRSLVLVDSLGLAPFRPSPGFAFGLVRFLLWPNKKTYSHFLPHCMYDVDDLSRQMGDNWEPFLTYNLERARNPDQKAALRTLMKEVGTPVIPEEDLAGINIPVTLIWGRHDRANKLQIAEGASERYGWPLYIIEEARDDPKLERPEEFLQVLYNILSETSENNLKQFNR